MEQFRAEIGKPTPGCPTELLDFDYTNPRLSTGDDLVTPDEQSIICSLREIAALDELIQSICTNTYLNLEPLIVLGEETGPFTVLEGNRRLASIKLIKDRALARECKISIPSEISQDVYDSIQTVTIWRVEKRSDAQAFIGFKHITGPHRWDAYAKARFVADWYKNERHNGLTVEAIARQLGDDSDTIRSYISAALILDQAEEERLFSKKDRYNRGRFAFSHLYTALGRKEYQEFLGLSKGWNISPSYRPIKDYYLNNLKEVLLYLYGSKKDNRPPLIKSQNPDLKHVGEVIVNDVALQKIRGGVDLKTAYNEVRSPLAVFSESLVQASLKVEAAIAALSKYDGSPGLLKIAEELRENVSILLLAMETKNKKVSNS